MSPPAKVGQEERVPQKGFHAGERLAPRQAYSPRLRGGSVTWAGAPTDSAPLPPGGVPGSGLHFRLSAAPDPDLQLCPASL